MFGMSGHSTVIHSNPGEHARAAFELDKAKYREQHLRNKKDPAGVGDIGVGDENQDMTDKDLERFRREYQSKFGFGPQFDINKMTIGMLVGSLVGIIIGCLNFQDDDVDLEYIMWGLLIGVFGGVALICLWMYYEITSQKKYKQEVQDRRAAIRRKEQMAVERHNEFVYYDAGTQQSKIFRFLCCPHFGKITTERVLYSQNAKAKFSCTPRALWYYFTACWRKETESLDYETITDVSVEQSCWQMCTNTGTVVLHCEAAADVSTIKMERDRLIKGLQAQDIKMLKTALLSSRNLASLKPLVQDADAMVDRLTAIEIEKCKKEKRVFVPIYVSEPKNENTAKCVRIPDVYNPYVVFDDLSYRVTKQLVNPGIDRHAMLKEAGRGASVIGSSGASTEAERKAMK